MKIIFLGATVFSCEILKSLLADGFRPGMIFGIPELFSISYSKQPVRNYNYGNLGTLATENDIPFRSIDGSHGRRLDDFTGEISSYRPDVILVMGWYYKVAEGIRNSAKYGAWGIHASLLPDYAGGAPLVWAMINGEKETGVSLFRLDDGVDTGDIVAQARLAIGPDDSIATVYGHATELSTNLLRRTLRDIGSLSLVPQDLSKRRLFPQRTPEDGEVDLQWPAERIHNFVRAQSSPYPGAFVRTIDGKKLIIEQTRIADAED